MSEQLIYDIAGQRYVLIEVLVVESNKDKMKYLGKKYECVHQGVRVDRGGFWSNTVIIFKWFVPEKNLIAFNKEIDD